MKIDFFQSIYKHHLIKKKELEEIIDVHEKVNYTKGSFLLKSGKIANEYYLIEKGLCRAYVHDFKGNQITTDFYSENNLCIEVSSLFQRIPSKENIIALTDGTAWKMEFKKFQELFHRIESFRELGRAWMSAKLFMCKQRQIEMITKNATERYQSLVLDEPEIVQHAPIKHIASYLGITDTSLSRIRKDTLFD